MLIDCAVVGAGPAGLATSAALSARGVEHVVLERGRVGESWRTQRWESFRLNTPGWMNQMLGAQARDSYATGVDVVQRLEKLAAHCPVREGVSVARLAPTSDSFVLQAGGGDLLARTVVVATGDQNLPTVPALAGTFPDRVAHYHTADYRGPDQLPDGAVLVVGSAQSGCQIAEDLLAGGRRVVVATSSVGRVPFRHRGRETIEWLAEAGFMDQRPRDLPDPSVMRTAMPILAPGRGLSLPALARAGVTLAGRPIAVDGERVTFDDSVVANVAAGDAFAARARAMVDEIIRRGGLDAPPAEPDEHDAHVDLDPPVWLDLHAEQVGSVVWCTGFSGDFSWLDPALAHPPPLQPPVRLPRRRRDHRRRGQGPPGTPDCSTTPIDTRWQAISSPTSQRERNEVLGLMEPWRRQHDQCIRPGAGGDRCHRSGPGRPGDRLPPHPSRQAVRDPRRLPAGGCQLRCHWDSLRLYSPARLAALPGMRFPAPPMSYPTKDDMADFLEAYASTFELPVRTGVRVSRGSREGGSYLVATDGPSFVCDNVVVASGTFGRTPYVPDFAGELDPAIVQLHSSAYKNPTQLQPGGVLVVGASHSGGDIAFEAGTAGHPTVLSGRIPGEVPFNITAKPAHVIFPSMFFVAKHVLTLKTPVGRKIRQEVRAHGGPLIRVKRADLARVGVELAPARTVGVRDGLPVLEGGRALEVANVVWCTGFRQDFSWIDLPVTGDDGWPLETRGVVPTSPGLYFVGLAFQYAFASMFVGGVGRDAEYVVKHLCAHTPAERRMDSVVDAA